MTWAGYAALTWTCHGCGDERPDRCILVMSTTAEVDWGGPVKLNLRYCNDRPSCAARVCEKLEQLRAVVSTGPTVVSTGPAPA